VCLGVCVRVVSFVWVDLIKCFIYIILFVGVCIDWYGFSEEGYIATLPVLCFAI